MRGCPGLKFALSNTPGHRHRPASESEFEGQLHEARIVHGRVYSAESLSIDVVDRRTKLRVIEEVEELGTEIQAHAFARQR